MSGTIDNEKAFVQKAIIAYGPEFKDHLRTKGFISHWFLHYWAAVSEIINQSAFGPRVLDLGCGPGWSSIFLAGRGYEVQAMDVSDDMLAIARENAEKYGLKIDFQQGDMQSAGFHTVKRGFDSVFIMDALHHCADEKAVLANCWKALRPGGSILIVEPDWFHEYSPSSAKDRELFGTTERGLSSRLIKRSLRQSGFIKPQRFFCIYSTARSGLKSSLKALMSTFATVTIGYPHRPVIIYAEKPV